MADLQPTYGSFSCIGRVVGVSNQNFFTESEKEGESAWRRVSFKLRTSHNSFIPLELFGVKTDQVHKIYKKNYTYNKDDRIIVSWEDRYKQIPNYVLAMPVNVGLIDGQEERLLPFDATEYIEEHLKDGMSVFVKGNIEFIDHKDKVYEKYSIRDIQLIPNKDDFLSKLHSDTYFQQEVVVDKVDDNNLYCFILKRQSGATKVIPYKFSLYDNEELLTYLKTLEFGCVLKVHGTIEFTAEISLEGLTVGLWKHMLVRGSQNVSELKYSAEDLESTQDPFVYVEAEEDEFEFN